jgi:hypothetical protein
METQYMEKSFSTLNFKNLIELNINFDETYMSCGGLLQMLKYISLEMP